MPPKAGSWGTPEEWLRRAKSNLAKAKQPKPKEAYWEDLCFDAQQAAEKAIKGALVFRGVDFPRIHDLAELMTLLKHSDQEIPDELWETDDLTEYATETSCARMAEPVTEDEYRKAVALAEQVVGWAEKMLSEDCR